MNESAVDTARSAVAEAKQALHAAEARLRALTDSSVTAVAEAIHSLTCTMNHVDQCAWNYEDDDWGAAAHAGFLSAAIDFLDFVQKENGPTRQDVADSLDLLAQVHGRRT